MEHTETNPSSTAPSKEGDPMILRTTHPYRTIGLGALLGASAAFICSALMIARRNRLDDYLVQSAANEADTEGEIQDHDEKVYRDEVEHANA